MTGHQYGTHLCKVCMHHVVCPNRTQGQPALVAAAGAAVLTPTRLHPRAGHGLQAAEHPQGSTLCIMLQMMLMLEALLLLLVVLLLVLLVVGCW